MTNQEKVRRARKDLAEMIHNRMFVLEVDEGQVAERSNTQRIVVERLLKKIPNPTRSEITRIIGVLDFSKADKRRALQYLDIFSPSKPARSRPNQ